jgi:hypothetical protein
MRARAPRHSIARELPPSPEWISPFSFSSPPLPLPIPQVLTSSSNETHRQTASVLLRKVAFSSKDDPILFARLPPEARAGLMATLVQSISSDPVRLVRHSTIDLLGECAIFAFHGPLGTDPINLNAAPQVWDFLQRASVSPSHEQQESAMILIERLSDFIVGEFPPEALAQMCSVLQARITDGAAPLATRTAAARAAAGILHGAPDERLTHLSPLLPLLLQLLSVAVQISEQRGGDDYADATEVAGAIAAVAGEAAPLFKPILRETCTLLAQIAGNTKYATDLRGSCLETLITLAEEDPSMIRKVDNGGFYLGLVLPVAFGMLVEYGEGGEEDDLAAWDKVDEATESEDEKDAEGRHVEHGEEAVGRIAAALGQKRFFPALQQAVSSFLQRASVPSDWKYRAAALAALRECAQLELDEKQLTTVATWAEAFTRDQHPRVRHAALQVLGNYCYSKGPVFQTATHALVAPALVAALRDPGSKKVRRCAAMGAMLFTDSLDPLGDGDLVAPYLEPLLGALLENLTSATTQTTAGDQAMAEITLKSVTSVCGAAGERVAPYYAMLSQGLKAILMAAETSGPSVASPTAGAGAASPSASAASSPSSSLSPVASSPKGGLARASQAERDRLEAARHSRRMKGMALEGLTVMGKAVDAAVFHDDGVLCLKGCVALLNALAAERGAGAAAGVAADDPVQAYVWDALPRLAIALGPDEFGPFLQYLVPPLLVASANGACIAEIKGVDGAEEAAAALKQNEDDVEDGDDIVQTSKGKTLHVKTSLLEDRQAALDALNSLFGVVKGPQIAPYAPAALQTAVQTLRLEEGIFEDLKISCAISLDDLFTSLASQVSVPDLEAALGAGVGLANFNEAAAPRTGGTLYLQFLYAAVDALEASAVEGSSAMYNTVANAVGDLLKAGCARYHFAGQPGVESLPVSARYLPLLRADRLDKVTKLLLRIKQGALQRRAVRAAERTVKKDELDEEALEQMEDEDHEDQQTCFFVTESLGDCIRTHGQAYLPAYAANLADVVQSSVDPVCIPLDRQLGIFVMDDLLEHCGDAAVDVRTGASLVAPYLDILVREATSSNEGIAQAAVFGLGAAAGSCPVGFVPHLVRAVQVLAATVGQRASKRGKTDAVHDNAVAALARVVGSQLRAAGGPGMAALAPTGMTRRAILEGILTRLPLTADLEESAQMNIILADWLTARDADLLALAAPGSAGLASVVRSFAWACQEENVTSLDATARRMRARVGDAMLELQGLLPAEAMAAVWAGMAPEEQAALTAVGKAAVERRAAGGSGGGGGAAASPPGTPGRA